MSSKPWLALMSDGRIVRWSDDPPYVDGDDLLTDEVLGRMEGDGMVGLTPNGPFVPIDAADPLAVLAVLREIDPKVRVGRDAPTTDTLPEDAIS